jgi:hypothetical protein
MTDEEFKVERGALRNYVIHRIRELCDDGMNYFEAVDKASREWFVGEGYEDQPNTPPPAGH